METSIEYDLIFDRIISDAKECGIILVTSAGNDGFCPGSRDLGLGDMFPQDRGTRDNEIITVGSVYQDGTIWEGGSPRGVHLGFRARFVQNPDDVLLRASPRARLGWVDIYAPGVDVEMPSAHDGARMLATGTSVSTAMVVSASRQK